MALKKSIDDVPVAAIGWVRQSRHHAETKQVVALQEAGCTTIYSASEHHVSDLIKSLRPSAPEAVRVTTLARLARTRDDLKLAIEQIHARGCWVEEISTGRSTRDALVASAMALDAANELTMDGRAPTRRQARKMAAKSLVVRLANLERDRMPRGEAYEIWHNRPTWSVQDCLAAMPGWTIGTAYRRLGRRGLGKGRPINRQSKE